MLSGQSPSCEENFGDVCMDVTPQKIGKKFSDFEIAAYSLSGGWL